MVFGPLLQENAIHTHTGTSIYRAPFLFVKCPKSYMCSSTTHARCCYSVVLHWVVSLGRLFVELVNSNCQGGLREAIIYNDVLSVGYRFSKIIYNYLTADGSGAEDSCDRLTQ